MKEQKVKLTDEQVRKLIAKLCDATAKAGNAALAKMREGHKSGHCNCSQVRRDFANAILPHILKLNSGTAAEFISMILANTIINNARQLVEKEAMLDNLKGLLSKLAKGQKPEPVGGDEWKNGGEE